MYPVVFREVLAFALRLVQLRLDDSPNAADPAARAALLAELRTECGRQAQRRAEPPTGTTEPRLGSYPGKAALQTEAARTDSTPSPGSQITEEMFAQFCESTGLASASIAASGVNLAALMFYVVIYSVAIGDRVVSLERKQRLLQTIQQCKDYFLTLEISPTPLQVLPPGHLPRSGARYLCR